MSGIGKKLPAGWGWKRLGDICIEDKVIIDGRNSTLPFIGMEMIKSGTGEIDLEAQTMPGVSTCYYFDERHILYGKLRPYLNKVALPNFSGRCSTELVPLFPINGNCRGFLAYLLRRNETIEYIMKEKTGSRMPRANMKYLLSMKIPVPPIEEQERIVKIIETKLTAIEQARRASDEQKKIIIDFLSSFIQNLIYNKDWKKYNFGDICLFTGGSQPPKSTFAYQPKKDYIRLVQIQDFRKDDTAVYIPKETARKTFTKDNVMIGRYGPPVFQILRGLDGAYNVALIKAEPLDNNVLDNNFLFYLLQEKKLQNAVINQSQRSAGQSGVDKLFLEKQIVNIPDINTQKSIVKKINIYKQKSIILQSYINEQSQFINALPSAILRKVLNGDY